MTSPILSPGDPGYESWRQEYRQRKKSEHEKKLLVLLLLIIFGGGVWCTITQIFGLPQWSGYIIGYIASGLAFYVYVIIIDDFSIREHIKNKEWTLSAAHLFLFSAFWPLMILLLEE